MRAIAIAVLLILSGCQASMYGMAKDMERIQAGMSHDEVVAAMGAPLSSSVDTDRHEETLTYRKMVNVTDAWPQVYSIVLRDNKVVRYGAARNTLDVYQR